jgi:ATP-dependent RNA helicase RhlE
MSFSDFGLHSTLLSAIAEEGYSTPTPIQNQAIPLVLEGRDLFGLAQTGTGKTAAFALPILNRYHEEKQKASPLLSKIGVNPAKKGPRCLVLTPTRELAMQVAESFSTYGRKTRLRVAVVFGGVGIEPQKKALSQHPEILVATPGRLLDLLGQKSTTLSHIDTFVLDEADRMFDMGFVRDIRRVVEMLPKERQTLLFSATMPNEIADLAKGILRSPARVEVTPAYKATDTVKQSVYFVSPKDRVPLMQELLKEHGVKRCIVFTRMKHVANRVSDALQKAGIHAEPFHSNKSQNTRVRTLNGFKTGQVRVLVATDIAARGLDVDDVEVVINYDLPDVPETYVHRIGRAGRAGKQGLAWSLCTPEDREILADIEKKTRVEPLLVSEHEFTNPVTANTLEAHIAFREKRKNAPHTPKGPSHSKQPLPHQAPKKALSLKTGDHKSPARNKPGHAPQRKTTKAPRHP